MITRPLLSAKIQPIRRAGGGPAWAPAVGGSHLKVGSLQAVARALNDARVRFILVGGLAVNAHGYPRLTVDVDLVIQLTAENIRNAFAALASLGYLPRVPVNADAFADPEQRQSWIDEKGMQVLNFHSDAHRETPVDIFVREPFDFNREFERATSEEVADGVSLRVVNLASLIRLKLEAGRPQDLADIAELRALHPGEDDE